MKTFSEQIADLENTRAAKSARMSDVINKSLSDGRSTDAAEAEEFDTLELEVKQLDGDLVRLRKMEEMNLKAAKPVAATNVASGSAARDSGSITVKSNAPKGTAFARYVQTLAAAKGNLMQAAEMAKRYDGSTPEVSLVLRAAVAAGTTTDASWAAPLVPYQQMTSEFVELLRPATIIGKLVGLRNVPFNIKMPTQTGGSSVNWVGQGAPKPVSSLAFGNLTLDFTKTAGIVVISEELARLSTPSAEAIIRQDLIDQSAQFTDVAFVDPSKAAVAGVSPASITNGAPTFTASGVDADALRRDIRKLIGVFTAANMSAAGAAWIMTETQATAISMMTNALGQPEFPTVNPIGGTLFGMPIVTSESVVSTTVVGPPIVTTSAIILVKTSEILLADDGGVSIDVSREASLQMDTAPTNPPTATTVMVSLWQMNMIGIRAERYINWVRRRPQAVAYISNANYG